MIKYRCFNKVKKVFFKWDLTMGFSLTERVMIELVKKGVGRQEAHEMIRRISQKSWGDKIDFREGILGDEEARKYISENEIEEWLNPHSYLGTAIEQVRIVSEKLKPLINPSTN